jgi:hypothetical protein
MPFAATHCNEASVPLGGACVPWGHAGMVHLEGVDLRFSGN